MSAEDIQKWSAAASAMPGGQLALGMPLDTFLGEAIDVAKFHAKHWKAQRDEDGNVVFPGLELGVGKGPRKKPLKSTTGKDIRSLHAAVRHADTLYQFALTPVSRAPAQEGRQILSKLSSALAYAFDDGIEDDNDTKLANLEARHAEPGTHDALANALDAYATLAAEVRDLLESFEIFDVSNIDRASLVARTLRDGPAKPAKDEATPALALRNRLCQLLHKHVRMVRDAAGFVFQDYPEVRREATSSHLRRQRAAARSRSAKAEELDGSPGASETET